MLLWPEPIAAVINASPTPAVNARVPLVVDLDGTLIATDTVWELLVAFLKRRPLGIFSLLRLGFASRPHFKARFKEYLAAAAALDVESLPYQPGCLAWVRAERQAGRTIWLATGAPAKIANAVAAHLNLFDGVIASDGINTATGHNKADLIASVLDGEAYDYAGNALVDMAIWRKSRSAIVVAPRRGVLAELKRQNIAVAGYFPAPAAKLKVWVKALRMHQWVKNLLVFTPLLASHRLFDAAGWVRAACGFAVFSLIASSTYLINDLLDLPADRRHVTKAARGLAAGLISIPSALGAIFGLLAASAFLSVFLPWQAAMLGFAYFTATLFYSAVVKKLLMADVVALALFYTARLLYGGLVTRIEISIWTLAFCAFSFFALAAAKRINELAKANLGIADSLRHRAYQARDLNALVSLAAASSNIAALVLILYINSPQVEKLYRHPRMLWTMCVPLVYWFSRILTLANRGALADDPVLFATKDRATYLVIIVMAVIAVLAT